MKTLKQKTKFRQVVINYAEKHGILHKLIKPYSTRHNGKVERSHRKDNEYFYAIHSLYSFDDFNKTTDFCNASLTNLH